MVHSGGLTQMSQKSDSETLDRLEGSEELELTELRDEREIDSERKLDLLELELLDTLERLDSDLFLIGIWEELLSLLLEDSDLSLILSPELELDVA